MHNFCIIWSFFLNSGLKLLNLVTNVTLKGLNVLEVISLFSHIKKQTNSKKNNPRVLAPTDLLLRN